METRHIEFEHTRLAVHLAGRGPLAMLIHGYPLDHRLWLDALHGPLAARHTLVAIDLRGHGGSPWCGDAVHTMDTFADDVAAVLRTLGDEPAHTVGLSMGGYVALALWANHRALVRSLALVDTRAAADGEAARAARDAAVRTAVEQGRRPLATAMLDKLLGKRAPDDPHGLLLRARVTTMATATPVETIVADLRGLRDRPDRTALLSGITVPTLVVVGSDDAITPPAEARTMAAAIPGAELVEVPRCGHLVPMEDPAAFAAALGAFWVRVDGA
ncbi:MAG: alpha/beta fold hydrolase [Planctomycetes bacterium]|nr:alpha/beta fold hydrolase [Planctomycetota bacterium]